MFFSPGLSLTREDILDVRPYLAALGKLPFSVLAKMSPAPFYNVSRNIRITEDAAVSHRSVLAHRAVRLFIGQGGGQNVVESVFHRRPMLVMPSTNKEQVTRLIMYRAGITFRNFKDTDPKYFLGKNFSSNMWLKDVFHIFDVT